MCVGGGRGHKSALSLPPTLKKKNVKRNLLKVTNDLERLTPYIIKHAKA